jgi:tetratricopeptide (TPR) repeat protein
MISDLLATAWEHHQTGDFVQAEALYRQVVEEDPGQADALRALGGIAYRQGKQDEAIAWLRRAVIGQPSDPVLHNNLGAAYRASGRLAEAEARYRQALRLKPDFAEAYNNLGNVLAGQGRPQEALARYRLAVLTQAHYAEAHHNLAMGLLGLGELDEADVHFREALRRQPAFAEAHYGSGLVALQRNKLDEAAGQLEEALRLQPLLADAHFQLGQVLRRQGQATQALPHLFEALRLKTAAAPAPVPAPGQQERDATSPEISVETAMASDGAEALQRGLALQSEGKIDDAVALFREAARIDPDSAKAYRALGRALEGQGRLEEAVAAYLQVARIHPGGAEAYLSLGRASREQVQLDRAVAFLRESIRLRPDSSDAFAQLGLALTDQGLEEEAENAFRAALRLKPDSVLALSHLGILLEESDRAADGQTLIQRALELNPADVKVHVYYGVSLVNQGRFEEARAQFLEALRLQPSCAAAYFFLARDVKHPFAAADVRRMDDLVQRSHQSLQDRANLHFALARVYDRSGDYDRAFDHCEQGSSAKLELLKRQGNAFDSAGHVRQVDRLIATFTQEYFERVKGFGSSSELPVFIVGMPRSGTTLVEQIIASHPDVFGAGETRNVRRLLTELPVEIVTGGEYPECVAGLTREVADRLADGFLERLRMLGGEKSRVTDKLPMNFHHLGLIATLFPHARIIHCRRDPLDVGWSCYFQNFREIYFASDLRVLGEYQRQYERLMAHWAKVLPVPVLDVSYEVLVENLEREARKLVSFCGLPWDDRCLAFYEAKRVVRTSSNFQVRQPVYKGAVGYWRHYERHLGPLIESLGPDLPRQGPT